MACTLLLHGKGEDETWQTQDGASATVGSGSWERQCLCLPSLEPKVRLYKKYDGVVFRYTNILVSWRYTKDKVILNCRPWWGRVLSLSEYISW